METRARYVLIGAFTLAGLLGLMGFVLWFASVGVDQDLAYYDVDFDTVSGLSTGSAVRFSGFPVGQVVSLDLAPENTGQIRVRIEVNADTPVRTGTVATVESQGVTGLASVGLTPGDRDQPLLRDVSDDDIPAIPAGRSVLQALSEDAPKIIEEALEATRQVGTLLGPENQERVSAILENLETSSANLGQAMDDFSEVTVTIATASEEIAAFTGRLDAISSAATGALETADTTLQRVAELADRAGATLDTGDAALESGQRAFDSVDRFVADDLPGLVTDLSDTTAQVRAQFDLLTDEARAMMQDLRTTGALASDRLREAEATVTATDVMLAQLTETLTAVETASQSLQTLVDGDGAALVADLRDTIARADGLIASATTVATEDLPAVVADIRTATDAAARAVEEVSADLSTAAGRIDGISGQAEATLVSIADTFEAANETLGTLNAAIEIGERTLAAADRAFAAADAVLREDIAVLAADLRSALDGLDDAVALVLADLPEITGSLRDTASRANAAFGQFETAVTSATGPIQSFATDGLPQYTRLAQETRTLISTFEKLIRNIERDPTRYLLGRDEPVYRR